MEMGAQVPSESPPAAGSGAPPPAAGNAGASAGASTDAPDAGAPDVPADAAAGSEATPSEGEAPRGLGGSPAMPDSPMNVRPLFQPQGTAIKAEAEIWTWVPFADSRCRSGSMAGLGLSLNPASDNVMIFLDGGGACFNSETCSPISNADSIVRQQPLQAGIFDRAHPENPIRDWNFVYVPYCTGDVHLGTNEAGSIEGVSGVQYFVGRLNLLSFLHRLVPTFAAAHRVLLAGVNAGGFGASANAPFVQWAFGDIPLTMIDDSGPLFSENYVPRCLREIYRTTWGLDQSILRDCGAACTPDGDYTTQFLERTARLVNNRFTGTIESTEDSIIRGYFGIGTNGGLNDCQGSIFGGQPMDVETFQGGLREYRDRVRPFPGFSTFYPSGTQHTWLTSSSFYTGSAGGARLVDWFRGVLDGQPAKHLGL